MFGDIGNKVMHVLRSKQTRPHTCHWPGCKVEVPPAMWGCVDHWRMLPRVLRAKLWAAYRPGQEIDGNPSEHYMAVLREIRAWISEHRGL